MGLRIAALASATVLAATTAAAVPAAASTGSASAAWTATVLPFPAGYPAGKGYLNGTDGHGHYAGSFAFGTRTTVLTWSGSTPTDRGLPPGSNFADVADENASATVVGTTINAKTGLERTYTLTGATFTLLPLVSGYDESAAVAINDNGDVLGTLFTSAPPYKSAAVLWKHLAPGPVVINYTHEYESAADLDDDASVLLNSPDAALVWRNGTTTTIPVPSGYTQVSAAAIRKGIVVGGAFSTAKDQAYRWSVSATGPAGPKPLPGGSYAGAINATGLTTGVDARNQPITWVVTTSAGALPIPSGYAGAGASHVGDDGAVVGIASNGPLDEGGVPVLWRRIS